MLIFIYKHDLVFHFLSCFVRNIYVQIDKSNLVTLFSGFVKFSKTEIWVLMEIAI